MHGTFFCDFPGFPVLVGTLAYTPVHPEAGLYTKVDENLS